MTSKVLRFDGIDTDYSFRRFRGGGREIVLTIPTLYKLAISNGAGEIPCGRGPGNTEKFSAFRINSENASALDSESKRIQKAAVT